MVNEMHKRIVAFDMVNRTHCFLHILNLIAKSMLKQFELPEKKDDNLTNAEREILGDIVELAEDIEAKEQLTRKKREWEIEGNEIDEDDKDDWVDKVKLTAEEEREQKENVIPITCVLVKGSNAKTYHVSHY
jgi:hypothetical protein